MIAHSAEQIVPASELPIFVDADAADFCTKRE